MMMMMMSVSSHLYRSVCFIEAKKMAQKRHKHSVASVLGPMMMMMMMSVSSHLYRSVCFIEAKKMAQKRHKQFPQHFGEKEKGR